MLPSRSLSQSTWRWLGFHGAADAHQSNTAQFLQGASQAAGGGGHGGNDMRRAAEACLSSRLARPTTTGLTPI